MGTPILPRIRRVISVCVTLTLLVLAAIALVAIWDHYLTGPWTRDGQVEAYTVDIAPEVSGRVVTLAIHDNQTVHKGDLLYEIDPSDYQVALGNAQATLQSREADLALKRVQDKRRQELTTLTTSAEEKQTYAANEQMSQAAYAAAITQLSQARINLARTRVVSPVNGYVTNLQLRLGDYASTGTRNVAILDSDSYWVSAYFEETKLAGIHPGDPARIALIGYKATLSGHVDSIARGIATPNSDTGERGLAAVNPIFTWVRLAQRIPVRVHIDSVPPGVLLAAGMTATVTVGKAAHRAPDRDLLSRLLSSDG